MSTNNGNSYEPMPPMEETEFIQMVKDVCEGNIQVYIREISPFILPKGEKVTLEHLCKFFPSSIPARIDSKWDMVLKYQGWEIPLKVNFGIGLDEKRKNS